MRFYDIIQDNVKIFPCYKKINKNLYHFHLNKNSKNFGIMEIIPSKFNFDDHNEDVYEIDLGIADSDFSSLLYGRKSINSLKVTHCIISNSLNDLSKNESSFKENNINEKQLMRIFTDTIYPYFNENLNSDYLIEKCLSRKWLIPNLYAAYYYKRLNNLKQCNEILIECKPQMNEYWFSKLISSTLFDVDQLKLL